MLHVRILLNSSFIPLTLIQVVLTLRFTMLGVDGLNLPLDGSSDEDATSCGTVEDEERERNDFQ